MSDATGPPGSDFVLLDHLVLDEYFPGKDAIRLTCTCSEPHADRVQTPERQAEQGMTFPILNSTARDLEAISQLGLKEVWLGSRPGAHNRWKHSCGVFCVSQIWLSWLQEHQRVPAHCLPPNGWPLLVFCR